MRRTIIATVALFGATAACAYAQEATTPVAPKYTFADVMRTCGAEWRESDARKATPGLAAWNAYRAECLQRKGFGRKATDNKPRPDFVRVPDKT